jgi:hypothetical protein
MSQKHRDLYPGSDYVSTETIEVSRLDTLAPRILKDTDRAALKIDVQGYEMQVLKGALETLARVQVIEAEICLTALYQNQSLPGELITFLHEAGFDFVSLEKGDIDPATGHVLWIDGIFVRRGSPD